MSITENREEPPKIKEGGFEQLKLLFDYTKFHIGLYTTLVTLLIALISLGSELAFLQRSALAATTVCFVLAGACGGVIASNIPYFATLGEFRRAGFGPRWLWRPERQMADERTPNPGYAMFPILKGPTWASLEHLFFWLGIVIALIGTGWSLFATGAPLPQTPDCNPIYLECRPH